MGRVNESELDWMELDQGETKFRRKQLGDAAGSERLGCSLYELPSGHKSWPYHYHTANEEAMYVLAGSGLLRLDGDTHDLSEGDYAAFPADTGGHRVINDAESPLRYLMVSTMNEPDISVYPESGKLGVFVHHPAGETNAHSTATTPSTTILTTGMRSNAA